MTNPATPLAARSPATSAVQQNDARARAKPVFLSMPQLAERYAGVWSRDQLYEHVRRGMIPHRKFPGRRDLLFPIADLEAFENGAPLETVKLPDGGRICRPRKQ